MFSAKLIACAGLAAIFAATSPLAASELVDDTGTIGLKRACTYASGDDLTQTTTFLVGLGESCPTRMPRTTSALRPPPTARLTKTEIVNRQRVCTFSQGGTDWTVPVSIDRPCPISAGMIRSAAE